MAKQKNSECEPFLESRARTISKIPFWSPPWRFGGVACMLQWPQRLCWLEHCLLVGSPMPDMWRGWDQTKSDQLTVACRQSVVSVAISDRLEYWFVLHRSLSFIWRGSNSQVRWLLQLSRGLSTLDRIATETILLRQYGKSYKQH